MIGVDLRKAPDPMRRKKFILIKQPHADPAQMVLGNKGKQKAVITPLTKIIDQRLRTGALMQKPTQALRNIQNRQTLNGVHIKTGHSQQRNQTRKRSRLQEGRTAIRPLDHVIIEAILFIPIHIGAISFRIEGES